MQTADSDVRTEPVPRTRRWWSYTALRVVATVHLVAITGQPVFAGLFLSGAYDMLEMHATNAIFILASGACQLLAAVAVWWRHKLRWPIFVSVLITTGEVVQYEIGQAVALQIHMPLGVSLVVAVTIMAVALWRPRTLGFGGDGR